MITCKQSHVWLPIAFFEISMTNTAIASEDRVFTQAGVSATVIDFCGADMILLQRP